MALIHNIQHDLYPFIDPATNPSLKDCAQGKTVLVTGAGQGIGKRIAEYFALAGAATVILTGRRGPRLEEGKASIEQLVPHCNVVTAAVDISDRGSVERLFSDLRAGDAPGVPDVLVNNAGACASIRPIVDSDPEQWWNDAECNVKGTYLCCRSYLIALNGKQGTIIYVSSGASSGVAPGFSGYSAGKSAINRLTEYIDAEHSAQGVRCFALHPLRHRVDRQGPDGARVAKAIPHRHNRPCRGKLPVPFHRAGGLPAGSPHQRETGDLEELEGKKDAIVTMDLLKTRVALA